MKLNAVHLNGLRAVEAAARAGSLQKAADELGVSASAVSQQISRAEAQIGQAVFERTSSGLKMTTFGSEFTARLSAGFRELEGAVALAERANACVLAVSIAPAFASKWLLPRLSRHFARHPEVILRIDASKDLVDLDHSDIDVAMPPGQWPVAECPCRATDPAGDFPGLRAGDRRKAQAAGRPRRNLGDHRRERDVPLGALVQGGGSRRH